MDTFLTIKNKLDERGIVYSMSEHEAVFTSEQAAMIRGRSVEEGMKRGAKAMIIRSEGRFFQFVLPAHLKLDFEKIKKILNSKSASLARADEVENVIGCRPGAVPPFGMLFGVETFVDSHLLLNDEINFNAGRHTVSVTMKVRDWEKVVNAKVAEFVQKE